MLRRALVEISGKLAKQPFLRGSRVFTVPQPTVDGQLTFHSRAAYSFPKISDERVGKSPISEFSCPKFNFNLILAFCLSVPYSRF